METKRCSRCGEIKPLVDFRHYYGGRKGYYKYCKQCHALQSRYQYLKSLGDKRTEAQETELDKINQVYDLAVANGLEAPGRYSPNTQSQAHMDALLNKFGGASNVGV